MKIEHKLMPGFVMEVLEIVECEADPEPHPAYRIIDPEGATDTLCSRDVTVVAE